MSFNNLVEILQYRAATVPDAVAYTYLEDGTGEVSLTYAEVYAQAQKFAGALAVKSAPGDRVMIILPPGLEYVTAFYGCLLANRIAVPSYPLINGKGMERILAIVQRATPKVIMGPASHKPGLQALAQMTQGAVLCPEELDAAETEGEVHLTVNPQDVAFIQFTSGSTGDPKGVMVSHANLMANLQAIKDCFGLSEASVGVSWLPPYHDMGLVAGILGAVFVGGRSINMSPFSFIQKPLRWLEAISRYRGNVSGGPNFAYRLCRERIKPEDLAALDLSSWHVAFCGAEPIDQHNQSVFTETFSDAGFSSDAWLNCYGLAESTLIVSGTRGRRSVRDGRVGCGDIVNNHQVMIVDPNTGLRVDDGREGEIWVGGPSVAQGYWNDADKTGETFQGRVSGAGEEDVFLRTGDLGYLHKGELFVTGRLKDLIIIRGANYYPQDIESVAGSAHEALNGGSIAAFPIAHEGEERLVIVAEIRKAFRRMDNTDVVLGEMMKAVTAQFSLRPHEIVLADVGSVPKTTSGKIRRQQCKLDYLGGRVKAFQPVTTVCS